MILSIQLKDHILIQILSLLDRMFYLFTYLAIRKQILIYGKRSKQWLTLLLIVYC